MELSLCRLLLACLPLSDSSLAGHHIIHLITIPVNGATVYVKTKVCYILSENLTSQTGISIYRNV